jgi:hypothetical protein
MTDRQMAGSSLLAGSPSFLLLVCGTVPLCLWGCAVRLAGRRLVLPHTTTGCSLLKYRSNHATQLVAPFCAKGPTMPAQECTQALRLAQSVNTHEHESPHSFMTPRSLPRLTAHATHAWCVCWWWRRERLQRAYDGFHSSDCAGLAHMTEYQDLDGPNIPVPGGCRVFCNALLVICVWMLGCETEE